MRKKKTIRVRLPEGVTAREVRAAVARLRRNGENRNPLDVAVTIVAEKEAAALSERRAEGAADPQAVLS